MRATGIVRRIDDLGRVVVPKEIRKTLRIREGDPVEIFTDREGQIILKKYSPIGEMGGFAQLYAESLSQIAGHKVLVTDRDQVIAVAGGLKKELCGREIASDLEEIMEFREVYDSAKKGKCVKILENEEWLGVQQIIYPIICEGDIIGSVVILGKSEGEQMSETENKLAGVAAVFLGRQMEG